MRAEGRSTVLRDDLLERMDGGLAHGVYLGPEEADEGRAASLLHDGEAIEG